MKIPFCTDCDPWVDTLAGSEPVADSLRAQGPGADYFFGPQSEFFPGAKSTPRWIDQFPWIDSYAYEALVVGIFILACYLLYRYRGSIGMLFKMQTHRVPLEKVYEEQTLFFKNFLRISLVLMALLAGGIAVRLCDFWQLSDRLPGLSRRGINLVVPAVLAAIGGVMLYRYLANRLISGVTQNSLFFDRYRFMNRVFSALSAVALTPLFLVCALYDGEAVRWVVYLMLAVMGLLAGAYLGTSYRFFVVRNVSILQWILYLCAVEIFPLSLLLFAGLRNAP